jgi:NAD(P)H-hydrate epimerase
MATGGSGDVLTGIITGLLAQGLEPADAAIAGVYIHGLAGDIACAELGNLGIIAGDIGACVPEALLRIQEGSL